MLNQFKHRDYQVILAFHDDKPESFERVLALERTLEEFLENGEVDGNDVGQGIVNIYMITKEPRLCFDEAMRILSDKQPIPYAAGYCDLKEENYIRLWPNDDPTPFELK